MEYLSFDGIAGLLSKLRLLECLLCAELLDRVATARGDPRTLACSLILLNSLSGITPLYRQMHKDVIILVLRHIGHWKVVTVTLVCFKLCRDFSLV